MRVGEVGEARVVIVILLELSLRGPGMLTVLQGAAHSSKK